MDNQKAKFILQSYRGGADAADPQFAGALRAAGDDAELAEWLAEEQAWDNAIRRRLKRVPVPADLRAEILAGAGAVTSRAAQPRSNWLALAASVILFAAVAALWFRPSADNTKNFAAFRSGMVGQVAYGVNFDYQHADVMQIQRWLTEQRSLSNFVIPAGLQNKPGLGCRTFSWQGQPVGLICFLVGQNEAVHLFISSRSAVPDAPASGPAQFTQHGDWLTAGWTQGDTVYLVTARTRDKAYLQKYL